LGIEPAQNIAEYAEHEKGIPTLARFFSASVARDLRQEGRRPQVIIGNNVLAHVPDLNDFTRGVGELLADSGVASFEVPYLGEMLDRVEFDTIYHEHQCYFSLTALWALFERHDLHIVDVERIPIHGGSLRISVAHAGRRSTSPAVSRLLDEERAWGVNSEAPYARFRSSVQRVKNTLPELLGSLRPQVEGIAAYGAAAKGVTLLSVCGIGTQFLDYVVDRSPHKQNFRYPIDGLPIYSPEVLAERVPEYTLLLTWNFAHEILEQQRAYRAAGGKFILPVPYPKILR
jgi:hypothetical protein